MNIREQLYNKMFPMEFALNMINTAVQAKNNKQLQIFKTVDGFPNKWGRERIDTNIGWKTLDHLHMIATSLIWESGILFDDYVLIKGLISFYNCKVDKIPSINKLCDKFRLVYYPERLLNVSTTQTEDWSGITVGSFRLTRLIIMSEIGLQYKLKSGRWKHTNLFKNKEGSNNE